MLRRIDNVHPAPQHRESLAVGVERTLMRLAVNPARQPAYYGESLGRKLEPKPLRHPAPDITRRARPNNRNTIRISERSSPAHKQKRRRISNLAQVRGIIGVSPLDHPRA